jgi:8-oxo-dGTP pyrophosphatase MutT (NUDIX family)
LRSELLPQHAGQISFPGGRPNAGDASPEATALREAAEETGLDPHAVRILGRLPVVSGLSSGFAITPVVGWVDVRPSLVHDTREVAALIDLPLALALDPACYCVGELRRDGVVKEFWYLDYAGHRVWGATARVLRSLALALAD